MTDRRTRFDPAELDLELDHEAAGLLATARALEAYAESSPGAPSFGFEDRVMAAIANEPLPRPSARHGFVAMLRDSWAGAFGPGRPLAVRAQAFALLLIVAVAAGSIGSIAVVGAARLLTPDQSAPPVVTPTPSPSPVPSPSATPSPTVSPTPSPTPSATPTATQTARPTATETDEPSGTDDSGGDGDNSGPGGGGGDR